MWDLNLIRLLDFYLAFMFFIGTLRRFAQYRNMAQIAFTVPGRWPLLLKLIHDHRMVFATWGTIAPALLAALVMIVQLIASRGIWPMAGQPPHGLTVGVLLEHWPALFAVLPLGLAMVGFDAWGMTMVSKIDRTQLDKYFDQAEYWLRSPTAHVVRFATFGYINPRRMVNTEVRKALVAASSLINYTLWWMNIQVGLRLLFGLALWITWAFTL
jgi:hypothetical protein